MITSEAVELYIEEAEEKWQPLLKELRALMKSALPPIAEEHIKYKIPFYYCQGPLCYLNPRKQHLDLGFYRGAELSNEQGLLVGEDKKLVRHIQFLPEELEKVHDKALYQIIQEALLVNVWYATRKKKVSQ